MLVRFSIENFLSFKNKVILDMQAGTIKEHSEHVYSPFFERNTRLLKSAAIMGANSNGKSNLIKGFSFMKNFVMNSSKESHIGTKIPIEPFLLCTATETKPSFFEVVFFLGDLRYKYGFTVTSDFVESEWLAVMAKNKEESIFIRHKADFSIEKKFKGELKSQLEILTKFTRDNCLFISVLSQFNVEIGKLISTWFGNSIVALDTDQESLFQTSANLFKDIKYRQLLNDIIRHSGLGIEGIEEKLSLTITKHGYNRALLETLFKREIESLTIKTKHIKYDENNNPVDTVYLDMLQHESSGTQKYFGLLGPILVALHERRVFFIDELSSRLHTLLFEIIVKFFNSEKYNAGGAQLIFTTHDTNILRNHLRRDQMILVSKDDYGATSIGSLYQLKPQVRNDASFEKDYLKGLYGAIPSIQAQQLRLF
jgi:uncharacterized protein